MDQLEMPFEYEISQLEDMASESRGEDVIGDEVFESACGALSFASSLHQIFVENGMLAPGEEVDFDQMENLVDALFGELGAACIVLGSFEDAPRLLRNTGSGLAAKGVVEVPRVVVRGFERLADRVEKTTTTIKAVNGIQEKVKEI